MTGRCAALGAAVLCALLLAPSAAPAGNVTIRGPQTFTPIVLDHDFNMPPWCSMRTRGLAPPWSGGRGQVVVGYTNFFDPGTDPFPCWERIDHAYRGQVRFATQHMNRYRRGSQVGFTNAELWFTLVAGERSENGVAYERALWSAAARLGVVIGPWSATGVDAVLDGFPSATFLRALPTGAKPGGVRVTERTFRVPVTDMVVNWVCEARPNRGFVLRGPDEEFADDNDRYISRYRNFRLRLLNIGARKGARRC